MKRRQFGTQLRRGQQPTPQRLRPKSALSGHDLIIFPLALLGQREQGRLRLLGSDGMLLVHTEAMFY